MAEPRLSIVLPVLNEGPRLRGCLEALAPLRSRGAEIIVADGGSSDDSVTIAGGLADRVLCGPRGRARQMNAGAEAARGDTLLFLHADTQLPADATAWLDGLHVHRAEWGFFPVRLDGRNGLLRWVERGMNWRSRVTRVATGDQALWLRRSLFRAVGGFPDIALMEDVAMSKLLRRRAAPSVWTSPLTTSSRRWQQQGIVRTVLLMWWLRLQYVCGVSPDRLVRRYYGGSAGGR